TCASSSRWWSSSTPAWPDPRCLGAPLGREHRPAGRSQLGVELELLVVAAEVAVAAELPDVRLDLLSARHSDDQLGIRAPTPGGAQRGREGAPEPRVDVAYPQPDLAVAEDLDGRRPAQRQALGDVAREADQLGVINDLALDRLAAP